MKQPGLLPSRTIRRRLQRAALAAALTLTGCEGTVAKEQRSAEFGALLLSYDATAWSVTSGEDRFTAECIDIHCRGRIVRGRILAGSTCRAEDLQPDAGRAGRRITEIAVDGLHWLVAYGWRGCRNAHPESLAACTFHMGKAYRIEAPLLTCRTGPQPEAAATILSLIRGIAVATR